MENMNQSQEDLLIIEQEIDEENNNPTEIDSICLRECKQWSTSDNYVYIHSDGDVSFLKNTEINCVNEVGGTLWLCGSTDLKTIIEVRFPADVVKSVWKGYNEVISPEYNDRRGSLTKKGERVDCSASIATTFNETLSNGNRVFGIDLYDMPKVRTLIEENRKILERMKIFVSYEFDRKVISPYIPLDL